MQNAQTATIQLPSVADVGVKQYQRAWHDKRRIPKLLAEAQELAVDTSILREPTTWEQLSGYRKALKALIWRKKQYLAKKAVN